MSNKIRNARRVMRNAFEEDPDFRHSYQANIAMAIYDHLRGFDLGNQNERLDECNKTADNIIKLIFESGFDDEDKPPSKPTLAFLKAILFETTEDAQTMLDTEYPGYTIEEKDNGLHVMYNPEHVPYASTSSGYKFERYDSALKDLLG